VVKAVASLGVGVNLPVNDGSTPFCIAAEGRHVEVLKTLAARGADVNA
jgi:ankyrin repeat protein